MPQSGLEAVFLSIRGRLLRFLVARGASDAAEDILQEVWERAAHAQAGPIADPESYLYRIANNLLLDRRRAEMRAARRERDWQDVFVGDTAASAEPSGERVLIARQQLGEAEEVLEALGTRVATAFRRHRLEGQSQREIAAQLGISVSTLEKDLQKAYRAMIDLRRRMLAD